MQTEKALSAPLAPTPGHTFAFLLLPQFWSSRNRARNRERGDMLRASIFGAIGLVVCFAIFRGSYWLTTQLTAYAEFGDYLLRLALSWLFMTFLAFLTFSGVVAALSTFFLADVLRLRARDRCCLRDDLFHHPRRGGLQHLSCTDPIAASGRRLGARLGARRRSPRPPASLFA